MVPLFPFHTISVLLHTYKESKNIFIHNAKITYETI